MADTVLSGFTSWMETVLLFLYKLNDTIDTNWLAGLRIDEDVGRMHIFEIQTLADIVYAFTFSVVTKAF